MASKMRMKNFWNSSENGSNIFKTNDLSISDWSAIRKSIFLISSFKLVTKNNGWINFISLKQYVKLKIYLGIQTVCEFKKLHKWILIYIRKHKKGRILYWRSNILVWKWMRDILFIYFSLLNYHKLINFWWTHSYSSTKS